MALTINTNLEAMNASRNLNQHREHAGAVDAASVLGPAHQLGRRRRRRLRDQPAPAEPGQRAQPGGANSQDAVSLAQTAQGSLERRHADAPAHPRARRPVRQRHDLGNGPGSDQIRGSISSRKRSTASVKRRSSTASLLSPRSISSSRSAPTTEKSSTSRRSNSAKRSEGVGQLESIKSIDEAIAEVSSAAGEFGSVQDRIQYTQSNLEVYSQNLTSAVSALVDVNMATEMTNFTKDQVLQQAGVAILSQANAAARRGAAPDRTGSPQRTSSAVAPRGATAAAKPI